MVQLKGEFTNFDNVILNDAPRQYSNILEGLRIWSPLTGVFIFLRGPEGIRCLWDRFGLNFPSNSKCGNYTHTIFFIKSYRYIGAIISDLKIQIIIYKFVPINFLDAKNGHFITIYDYIFSLGSLLIHLRGPPSPVVKVTLNLGGIPQGNRKKIPLRGSKGHAIKVIRKFFKTNISIAAYTLVSPKKYFDKNLELCGSRNL